jgi:hypothetical protein
MTVTKQPPKQPAEKGTLFDSILDARSAFKKKPVEADFPPLIDPDVLESNKKPNQNNKIDAAARKVVAVAPIKRSLLPEPAPKKPYDEPSPYVYAGSKARKRIDWEDVPYEDALPVEVLEAQLNKTAVEEAKAKIKRTTSKVALDRRSKTIIESLPKDIQPLGIAETFPHIMNLIASSWQEPKMFVQTLDELLIDDRGNRAGFPFAVIVELTNLREFYFSSVRPEARKLWDRL